MFVDRNDQGGALTKDSYENLMAALRLIVKEVEKTRVLGQYHSQLEAYDKID